MYLTPLQQNIVKTALVMIVSDAQANNIYKGVAGVLIYLEDDPEIVAMYRVNKELQRDPDPQGRGADDKGTNYFGIASLKVATSLATGIESGTQIPDRTLRNGETEYSGCLILKQPRFGDRVLHVFYSGAPNGTNDQQFCRRALDYLANELT